MFLSRKTQMTFSELPTWFEPISGQNCTHIETGKLIRMTNQLTGFYMNVILA